MLTKVGRLLGHSTCAARMGGWVGRSCDRLVRVGSGRNRARNGRPFAILSCHQDVPHVCAPSAWRFVLLQSSPERRRRRSRARASSSAGTRSRTMRGVAARSRRRRWSSTASWRRSRVTGRRALVGRLESYTTTAGTTGPDYFYDTCRHD